MESLTLADGCGTLSALIKRELVSQVEILSSCSVLFGELSICASNPYLPHFHLDLKSNLRSAHSNIATKTREAFNSYKIYLKLLFKHI